MVHFSPKMKMGNVILAHLPLQTNRSVLTFPVFLPTEKAAAWELRVGFSLPPDQPPSTLLTLNPRAMFFPGGFRSRKTQNL